MNGNDSHQLSGAYAVHAVSEEEAAAVEAAMTDSEDLRGEIAELTDTAVALGLSLRPVTPPPAMRARLLDAIATTPQLPREEEPVDETPVVVVSASDSVHHVAPRRRRRMRMRRPSVLLATALAAVLLFAGGVVVNRTLQTPNEYQQIVAASDAHPWTERVAGGGTATVVWSKQEGAMTVQLTDVAVPAGKVLQLWTIRGDRVVSAGVYAPEDGANYVVRHGTPASGETLGVTMEPTGGSKHPTSIPIVQVPLSA